MQKHPLIIFVGVLFGFLLLGCGGNNTPPTPPIASTEIVQPSETPQATNTVQPSPKSELTSTVTPHTDFCPRATIPPNAMPPSSEVNGDKLITFTAGKDGYDDIYVMRLDGTGTKNITNNPAVDRFPVWSPDGKRIAFLSNRNYPAPNECRNMVSYECVFEIFSINRNGAGLTQISKGWNFSPVWSPDSQKIAYLYFLPSPYSTPDPINKNLDYLSDIYVVNTDHSSKPRNLSRQIGIGNYSDPVWSPDSKKLAFITDKGVAIVNSDGSGLLEYTQKDIGGLLFWSPKNEYILFHDMNGDVYKAKTDFSSVEKQAFRTKGFVSLTSLSPDGKWFIYSYYFTNGDEYCSQIRALNTDTLQDYFVFDLDSVKTISGNPSDAMIPSGLGISSVSWINNSQLIFTQWVSYKAIFGEFEELFTINLDGAGLQKINTDVGVSSPSVQP